MKWTSMYEASYGLHSFSTISHKTMAWTTCIPFNIIHTHTNTHKVLTDMKLNEKKKKNTLSEILFMSCVERVTCMNCVAHTHYKYFVVVFFFCHFDATTYHCCCCWSSLVLEYVFNGFKKTCISLKRFKLMGIDVKLTDVDCVWVNSKEGILFIEGDIRPINVTSILSKTRHTIKKPCFTI